MLTITAGIIIHLFIMQFPLPKIRSYFCLTSYQVRWSSAVGTLVDVCEVIGIIPLARIIAIFRIASSRVCARLSAETVPYAGDLRREELQFADHEFRRGLRG